MADDGASTPGSTEAERASVSSSGGASGGAAPAAEGAASAAQPTPLTNGRSGSPSLVAGPPPGVAVELLSKVHMFEGLQPAYLRRIAAIGTREQHATGTTIFSEGAVGDKMYLILSGAVRISRDIAGMGEEALAVLRPGNYFGEMSLIDDSPRSADAKSHEACEVFVIRKEDLEDLLFVDRDLAYDLLWNFVRTLTGRLRETNDKMTFLAVSNKF
ncbi:MAG: cyclic nucleotide-binding domain-containing protein [Pseudomonadota bacterium]